MDLIYANTAHEDLGVLQDYKLDLAFGQDENNFKLQIPTAAHCCDEGYYLYIDGTEYGGIIDSIQSDTGAQEVVYSGRTWHGVLNSKVIEPDSGASHLVLSGEANTVLGDLISRLGLTELFTASTAASGLTISSYQVPRYIAAYDGIRKMLETVGGKLRFTFSGGKVELAAVPRSDYTQDRELDSDLVDIKVLRNYHPVNHLICLGRGELAEREVVHLYRDAAGAISKTQTFTGIQERTDVYDNANAESLEDLEDGGRNRMEELATADEVGVNFNEDDLSYDIQDIVGATDNVTGITATAEIRKKIITIESGQVTVSYELGG